MSAQHQAAKTSYVKVNDITYAYRKLGEPNEDGVPLLFLHHFRGTMDLWDPLFVNLLSAKRQIILFDNAGVGQSTGEIPDSIAPMANHVYRFLRAVEIPTADIFGFSMGGMIAQQLALDHPEIVRKLILSGTGPGAGPNGGTNVPSPNSAAVGELATTANVEFDAMYTLFFYPTETSKAAARQWWKRTQERSSGTSGEERSYFVQGQGIMAQGAALAKWNGGEGSFNRLSEIKVPVLVTNGQDDFMVPTPNSFAMAQALPNATLIIYPDSGHGHPFQFPELYSQHVTLFLDE